MVEVGIGDVLSGEVGDTDCFEVGVQRFLVSFESEVLVALIDVGVEPFGVHFRQRLVALDRFMVLFLEGKDLGLAFEVLKS